MKGEQAEAAKRLQQARVAAGFGTAKDFAAEVGVKDVTYRSHEDGTRGFHKHLDFYAEKLGVSPNWLRYGVARKDEPLLLESHSFSFDNVKEQAKNGPLTRSGLTRSRDEKPRNQDLHLAIFGSLPGAAGGWIMNAMPAAYVDRPDRLKDAKEAFGLYMMGDDMWPRVKDGEPLYLHPTQLAKVEDCVVIFLKSQANEWVCRDLVDRRVDRIRVRKYGRETTPEEYDIAWSEIEKMYAVV